MSAAPAATATAVRPEQVAEVLTTARASIARRGLARGRRLGVVPGRAFGELPLSVDAALNIAAGHGPYPGCLTWDCDRCARADAARQLLAYRVVDGQLPTDPEADASAIERWIDHLRPSDAEVLAELDAAAHTARGATR